MRSKVIWFLLAASLALNLFFVAGVVWPRLMGHPHFPHRYDPVAKAAEEFSLDDSQTAALEALRGRMAERLADGRSARDGFQAILLRALEQPDFDRDALALALAERREQGDDMILDMTGELHGFLAGLGPRQKAAFLERAQERDFLRRLLFPPPPRRDRDDDERRPPPQ